MNEPPTTEPQITIQDIAFAVQCLDAATRRGAFNLAECRNVGELGARLTAFLEANQKQTQTSPTTTDEPTVAAS